MVGRWPGGYSEAGSAMFYLHHTHLPSPPAGADRRAPGGARDGSVKVAVGDYGRLRRLVRYLARPVVGQYDALTFLSLLALQVPPPGVHMARYYGHYSVRSRAERRRREGEGPAVVQSDPPPAVSTRRRNWAQLLRQVFEVDVLRCPKCEAEMKIISFISTAQSAVIQRILEHLGASTVIPRAHGPPEWAVKSERWIQGVLPRDEEDFSQAPPGWDEWEPA